MGIIIKQSIKGTLVNAVGIAVGFITTFFVITHYLTSEVVGLTRIMVDASVLFSSFAQLGTTSSIIRFFPYFKDEESKNHGFFFWTLVVPLVGFLLFLLVLTIFKQPILNVYADKSPLFVQYFKFVIPLSLFMLYQSVFETNCNVLMRIVVPKMVREVGVRVALLVIYILYGTHHITLDGLVVGFCITYLSAVIIDLIYLLTLGKISLKPDFKFLTKPLVKDFLFYTSFLILAAIAGSVTPLLNTFFVSAKLGLSFTGVFAIANYIATVIEIPNRSLNAIAQPNLAEAIKNNDMEKATMLCRSVTLHLLLSSTLIFFFIWINIDLLFNVLPNGEEYAAGKWVVFILGLARLSYSALSISNNALSYSRYYYYSLLFTVILTTSAILLNLFLIPKMGIEGAALSTLLAYLFYYLLLLAMTKWKLDISFLSLQHLKVLVIGVGLFLADYLVRKHLVASLVQVSDLSLVGQIAEGVIRSLVWLVVATVVVYHWHISEEVNRLLKKAWGKVFFLDSKT